MNYYNDSIYANICRAQFIIIKHLKPYANKMSVGINN